MKYPAYYFRKSFIRIFILALVLILSPLDSFSQEKALGAWQNPNIGFVFDMITDTSDVEGKTWTSTGVNVRSAELAVQSNVDPFGSLNGNFNFSEHGAALHEAYFTLPYLPGNLKLKGGYMLANFGRWTRFHTHAMPFVSEPRIYLEYVDGHITAKGLELSWLIPLPFYVEITFAAYDGISGHSHDSDPSPDGVSSEADLLALELGYSKHGTHYHTADGTLVLASDLVDESAPIVITSDTNNLRWQNLAYGGRIATTIEIGSNWSIDLGSSILHQARYKQSQRISELYYSKTLYGGDLTVFWHPQGRNLFRSLSFGVEYLGNYEGFERLESDLVYKDMLHRYGAIAFVQMKWNPTWSVGGFSELFYAKENEKRLRKRYGGFVTFSLSHFQFLRLEYNYYQKSDLMSAVNRILLQYDAVIGYHTHGKQR